MIRVCVCVCVCVCFAPGVEHVRHARLKSTCFFYVFSAPGGPKVRTRPKRGLKQNENSCFEHFLGVGIFRIFSGPGGVDFAKRALFASRGPQTS